MVWVHMPRTETAVPPVSLQGVHEGVLLWETVPDVVSSLSFSFISIFISLQGVECWSSRVLYTVRKEVFVDSQGSDSPTLAHAGSLKAARKLQDPNKDQATELRTC